MNHSEHTDIFINHRLLRYFTPARSCIYGILFYFFILLLSPVSLQCEFDVSSFTYICLSIASFCCGSLVVNPRRSQETFSLKTKHVQQAYKIILFLALIGTIAKFIDIFIIRNLSFSQNMFENREISLHYSGNAVALAAAFLMYAPYILLIFSFAVPASVTSGEKFLIWGLFGCQLIFPLMMGSRAGLLFPGLFLMIVLVYFKKIKLHLNTGIILVGVFLFACGCILSGSMYRDRILLMNPQAIVEEATRGEGAANTVPANDTVYHILSELDDTSLLKAGILGYVNICQYYLHGMLEFHGQKQYVDQLGAHSWGNYMFSVYYRFFQQMTGWNPSPVLLTSYFVRPGIFCSMFGYSYTDFGWFGLLFMFLFGGIQKKLWCIVYYSGNLILLSWIFLGSIIIFLFPLLNLFPVTMTYAFTLMIILYLILPMSVSPAKTQIEPSNSSRTLPLILRVHDGPESE